MIAKEKIKRIKKQLQHGTPAGEIKSQLLKEGYSEEDISKCFEVQKYDMRSWYFIFGIIFLFIGIWIFYYHGGIIFFIFSAAMFVQYYLAEKKEKARG